MSRLANWFFIVLSITVIITNLVFLAIDFSFHVDLRDGLLRVAYMVFGCLVLAYELTERDNRHGRR